MFVCLFVCDVWDTSGGGGRVSEVIYAMTLERDSMFLLSTAVTLRPVSNTLHMCMVGAVGLVSLSLI
jgi:hypothetical protein